MKLKVDIAIKKIQFCQGEVFWLIQSKVKEENFAVFLLEDFRGFRSIWKILENF